LKGKDLFFDKERGVPDHENHSRRFKISLGVLKSVVGYKNWF
jgi:hypothetical protein